MKNGLIIALALCTMSALLGVCLMLREVGPIRLPATRPDLPTTEAAGKPVRIYTVDMNRLVAGLPVTRKLVKRISKARAQLVAEEQRLEAGKDSAALVSQKRRWTQEIDRQKAAISRRLRSRLQARVEELAVERGIDFVFDSSAKSFTTSVVLAVDPGLDLTADLLTDPTLLNLKAREIASAPAD